MKKHIKNLVIYTAFFVFVIPANSQTTISLNSQVALSEAHTVATSAMLEEYDETERQYVRQSLSVTATNTYSVRDTTFMYEVFFNNGKGVLLSGNKNCLPVLGYLGNTEISVFDNDAPCCLTALLEGYVEQIRESFVDRKGNSENVEKWNSLLTGNINKNRATIVVAPLTTSKWGQSSSNDGHCDAYNYYVADKNCSNCYGNSKKPPAGCGAVAMAQVMYYWKYPANYGSAEYDWCNMTDALYASNPNYISNRNAVAYLIKDCASAIVTIYGCGGSISISTQIALALNRRGYTHALQLVDPQIWTGRIKRNLDNGRPLIIGLGGNGGGHFVVCDGYNSDDYFHFNWGWWGDWYGPNDTIVSQEDMWFTMDNIYDYSGTYPNGLKDYIYSIYPSDNFDYCNFNVTLTNASQDIPKYPTNLTVNFGNTTDNTITSGQDVTYFAHNSIVIEPGFKAEAGSHFVAHIEPCVGCDDSKHSVLLLNLGQPSQEATSFYDHEIANVEKLLQSETFNKKFNLYPNPNNGTFQIETNFPLSEISNLKISNLIGTTIYEAQHVTDHTIQLPNSASGMFFVVIILKDGSVLTQKMVVQR